MTLSCAVEVARRRKIQTIQAIGLSSDQVKKVAMGVKGYPGLKEMDLGGGSFGHVITTPSSLLQCHRRYYNAIVTPPPTASIFVKL